MKNSIRNLILGIMASALATCYFVGCTNSNQDFSSQPVDTTSISDTLIPGNQDSDANSFSIKYKYWYDNPDITENQSNHTAATVSVAAKDTGVNFLDLEGLPIYQDSEGNQYIISGRTKVYLADGKISPSTLFKGLREEVTGILHYFNLNASTSEFETALGTGGYTQPKTYEERIEEDTEPEVTSELYEVYLNNITTGYMYDKTSLLNISELLKSFSRGTFSSEENALTLYTAAGDLKITFTENNGLLILKYSGVEDTEDRTVEVEQYADMIQLDTTGIKMSLVAIERYLGYEVEVYDGDTHFINIVTDNKDIATEETIHTESIMPAIDDSLAGTDPSKPMSDPDNQTIIDDNNERLNNIPDYYDDPDVQKELEVNGDAVPNQDLRPADQPTGSEVAEESSDKITVDNAAEYYPYLGWCGYIPKYVEIYPGDSTEVIQQKIDWNAHGYSVSAYWGTDVDDHPQHFFTSEADYLAWKKQKDESQKSYEERMDQSDQDIRDGKYSADFGLTPEEAQEIFGITFE